jgi:hypothetical protein
LSLPGTIRERTKEHIAGWEIYGLRVVIASIRDDVAKTSKQWDWPGAREHSSSRPIRPDLEEGLVMKTSYKPIVLDAEPDETTLIVAEIDNLIATAEARIERQREYVRSVGSDFEGRVKAITDLERMTSSLDVLKQQRARIVRWEEEPRWNR